MAGRVSLKHRWKPLVGQWCDTFLFPWPELAHLV